MPSDATSPASATPNQPAGALSLQQAVEERIAQKAAAVEAPTVESAPEPAADETEQPEAAPVEVDNADSEADDANEPEDEDQTEEAPDEEAEASGDYIETPDGQKIPVEKAVQAFVDQERNEKIKRDLQARVTRKEQALAEERRALESDRQKVNGEYSATKAEREAIAAAREEYARRLKVLDSGAANDDQAWSTVDWEKLEAEDPIEAGRQWRAFERHEKRKVAIQREMQQVEAEHAKAMERSVRDARSKFQSFVAEKYPELIDPKEGSAHQQAMLQTALDAGYTPQEIEQTLDPRALSLWRKATLYDQLSAQKATVTAKPNAPKPDANGSFRVVKARGVSRPNVIPAPKAALGRAQAAFNTNPSFENGLALERAKREAGVRRG
jgi:hypothetical protein